MYKNPRENINDVYRRIKNGIHHLKLPSKKWMQIEDSGKKIDFVRIEDNFTSYLAVSFDEGLNVTVYYNNRVADWFEWKKPETEKDVENILQVVNDSISSGFMYVSEQIY